MKKILYHGSERVIEHPVFGNGKPYNDYGLGFYCTENCEMAKEWGAFRDRDGYANRYELETEGLKLLDLNKSNYCMLHWLAILLQNRTFNIQGGIALEAKEYLIDNFSVDYFEYDIIKGYRADDSYFSFAQDFINGTISYRQLCNAFRLGRLGQQIVLKSRKSFKQLSFLGYEKAEWNLWFSKKEQRDHMARRAYIELGSEKRRKDDLYILKMIDEGMKPDDPRLR